MFRLRSAVLALSLAALVPVVGGVRPAAALDDGYIANASAAVNLINNSRAAQGLCPVAWDPVLSSAASSWAGYLAAQGKLQHNDFMLSSGNAAGENVGYGSDIAQVHNMFSNHRPHLLNMIDARSTSVGVGFGYSGGRVYVTYDFRSNDGRQHRC